MRKTTVLLASLLVAAVATVAAPVAGGASPASGRPAFTPATGFGGDSEGRGSLRLLLGKPRPFRVASRGSEMGDGTFRLEQTVEFEGSPPRDRVWIIATVAPDRYAATLSDAAGPVSGTTSGPRLSLRYRVRGPLFMHQELELMPDGRTIDNVGTITLLGIPVGHLRETITRGATAARRWPDGQQPAATTLPP